MLEMSWRVSGRHGEESSAAQRVCLSGVRKVWRKFEMFCAAVANLLALAPLYKPCARLTRVRASRLCRRARDQIDHTHHEPVVMSAAGHGRAAQLRASTPSAPGPPAASQLRPTRFASSKQDGRVVELSSANS